MTDRDKLADLMREAGMYFPEAATFDQLLFSLALHLAVLTGSISRGLVRAAPSRPVMPTRPPRPSIDVVGEGSL